MASEVTDTEARTDNSLFGVRARAVSQYLREEALPRLAFIVCLVAAWWFASAYLTSGLLPTPVAVYEEARIILATGDFLFHLRNSLRRVLVAFLLAWAFSIFLGVWMGLSELAVFVAVSPMIILNFWEGVKDINTDLVEMGKVFDYSTLKTIRHIVLPQLIPYMLSAGRLGLGLAWKLVVIIEFLGFGNGIGYMLTTEYNRFNMAAVLAWTLLFTLVMIAIEYGGFKYLERRYLAWRPAVEIRKA